MGKTRHQKFLKTEKNKTKLKKKKEALPKGTNITKTEFKVKKIVIRDHGKPSSEEPLSNSKLSLKELLSRLQHFNASSRKDALNGVRELIANYPDEMSLNIGQLVFGVSPLVLDKERSVRRESFKTLHALLSPLSAGKIEPFFDILCSYLRCAMTHIDTHIHEDSLFFFDVLLECAADLAANNFNKILPSFFDMISKLRSDSQPGRTLSMNLGSKMTSVKWRTKVLLRLLQFLRVLIISKFRLRGVQIDSNENVSLLPVDASVSKNKIANCTYEFKPDGSRYFPIYRGLNLAKLSCFNRDNMDQTNDDNLKSYVESLMPLLFEAWLEVRPMSSDSKKVESVVSEEAMTLLQYILEIIVLLWQLLQFSAEDKKNAEVTRWFLNTYRNQFGQYFLAAFPYSQSGIRSKKSAEHAELTAKDICWQQNLRICHIHILFNERADRSNTDQIEAVLKYLKWSANQMSNNAHGQLQLANIFGLILKHSDWTKNEHMVPLLEKIISLYEDKNTTFGQNIFELLCSILLNQKLLYLQHTPCFKNWLSVLPKMMFEKRSISEKSLNIITKFAIQNNELFNKSIKSDLALIIKNLPRIEIDEIPNKLESRKKIVGLLYWINRWDNESLNVLQDQLADGSYHVDVRQHLVDLLKLKSEGLIPM